MAEGLIRNRVGKVKRQRRAVIDKLCGNGIAARQYDPGRGEVDRWGSWRHSIGKQPRGIRALATVAVNVEFDGGTLGNTTRRPRIGVGPVAKASPIPSKRSWAN